MRIAISGAGVAGPTLAYWLLRGGHTPTLIERAPAFRTGGYVVDFWGVGYEVAQRMGIEPAVREVGYRVRTVKGVRSSGKAVANIGVQAFARALDDRYVTIARGDLAATIYSAIENDVETFFDETITAVEDNPDGVAVSFENRLPRNFDLVIGADGLHSRVRRIAFPERNTERYLGCMVAAFVAKGYRPRNELTYVMYNMPGGQVSRFSLRDDRTLFLFIFRSPLGSAAPLDAEAGKQRLREEFGDAGWETRQILDQLDSADDLYFDIVSQVHLDRWSRGRVALVGDAAAAVSLLAGEGTGLAMAEAYVLAGELSVADGDHEAAFSAYEQRLRAFVAGKQASAHKFIPFFAARTRRALLLRNLGMRVVALPRLAEFLAARTFRDEFELPDYPM